MLGEVIDEGHRALVLSQLTGFLALGQDRLRSEKFGFAYLDGTTRKRDEVVAVFREGDAPVFLISLKAGGFGINLTEVDYVFILDPWWNPATENQATGRAHRIGQERQRLPARGHRHDRGEGGGAAGEQTRSVRQRHHLRVRRRGPAHGRRHPGTTRRVNLSNA